MKRWHVVKDLEGGTFGMYRKYTADEWRGQAFDWSEADGAFENEDEANDYEQMLKDMSDEELINYICDTWQVEMKEVKEPDTPLTINKLEQALQLLKEFHADYIQKCGTDYMADDIEHAYYQLGNVIIRLKRRRIK